MASTEHRKNMMIRWINQLKKEHVGRQVTRDIFLVPGFRPACFNDDPKKWAGEAFALCLQKKIMLPVDEKRGTWKFFNIHEIPDLEIANALDTPPAVPVVDGSQEAPVDHEHEHTEECEENDMRAEDTQRQTSEPMTEERFRELPGVSKMMFEILKSIYLLVGSAVFRYSQLRPSQHGYKNDQKDEGAFKQMIVKARSLGIIVGTDEHGNVYEGPRGLGYGKFVPGMTPMDWCVSVGISEAAKGVPPPAPSEVIPAPPQAPTSPTSTQATVPEVQLPMVASDRKIDSDIELENQRLKLENQRLRGQVVAYKKVIEQFIRQLRGGGT